MYGQSTLIDTVYKLPREFGRSTRGSPLHNPKYVSGGNSTPAWPTLLCPYMIASEESRSILINSINLGLLNFAGTRVYVGGCARPFGAPILATPLLTTCVPRPNDFHAPLVRTINLDLTSLFRNESSEVLAKKSLLLNCIFSTFMRMNEKPGYQLHLSEAPVIILMPFPLKVSSIGCSSCLVAIHLGRSTYTSPEIDMATMRVVHAQPLAVGMLGHYGYR